MAFQLTPGSAFAGYWIEGVVGRGGMAVVYRASDLALERPVALKLIAPELAQDEGFRKRFLRESRLAASLDHPNVVPIYEAGEERGLLYIAMRYVEGSDLRVLLEEEGTLAPERALRILAQIASALDAAHARGLVHRDVKPANALLDEQEHVYLTDFGLTKQLTHDISATPTGQMVGTLDYLAPEQIRGAEVDGRTDLYALACCLYQCLEGKPPFRRENEAGTLWAHMQEEPPVPREYPILGPVLDRGLAKEREERYGTCAELIVAAAEALEVEAPALVQRPSPPRSRLATALPRRQAERKVITVLFCDLVGYTSRVEGLDPEDVSGFLRPYHARVRAELERFGGTVEKFIGDAVMAVFGAPAAHEDDPERAVRAALAIRNFAGEEGIQLRVGVATGEALVSLGTRVERGEGMAAGDVVNTASRLETAAPVNGIIVDSRTFEATKEAIEYEGAEPVSAKGKPRPVPVWRPVAARAPIGSDRPHEAPLVGRSQERALLEGALARVLAERSPQLVTLVGVPGIGKSRLVFELFKVAQASPDPVSWLQGRCLPYGEGVTFWALGEMVKRQAGILETDTAEEAARKLHSAAELVDAGEREWVERHLGTLVGVGSHGSAGVRQRGEAFAAWRRFFEALAEAQPLVLVFEDLHWADENLLDFVDHLVDWASAVPLLVLCTARPQLFDRRADWGGGKSNALTLSLAPLSEGETAGLLAELLHGQPPAGLEPVLLERVGGNPLYAEQYARMLEERGGQSELPLPESVQGIIAARLDLLPPEEKALLQDAAVLGNVFWTGALASLAGVERAQAEERVHALERKEFVRRRGRSSVADESEIVFRHILVRDVAYGEIPRAERAERHRLAAEWIEALAPDRSESLAEMLADHYASALELARAAGGDTSPLEERARVALREAGDRAFALFSSAAAVRFYRAALELWPAEDPGRPGLLLRLGKALFWAESGGDEVLAEARDALLVANDREAASEAEVLLSRLLLIEGHGDRAIGLAKNATSLLADASVSPARAQALSNLAGFHMFALELEQAIEVASEALRMAEALELDDLRSHALTTLGVARLDAGDRGGLDDLERSVQLALEVNSPESVRGYANLASIIVHLGDVRRAFELYERGRREAERFGDARGLRWLAIERLYEHYWSGDWDEALRLANDLIAEVEAGAEQLAERDARLVRGWIGLARGDGRGALDDAAKAVEFCRATDPPGLLQTLAFRARALAETGSPVEAGAVADELLEQWASSGLKLASFWVADLAWALVDLRRTGDLLEAVNRPGTASTWLDAARLIAESDFRGAADVYGRIGSLPDEAIARQKAARALAAEGRRPEAGEQLRSAVAFHEKVKADAYLRDEWSLPAPAS
jgi:class 3 adenylate cyclase/tetratricopeptide (TPR) repeat protein